ncbi:hypothetical protein [Sphingopyxis sp. MSC1_008]|jgi:hypothetical protein|uniref:hypothetical protein n=1 Tax=Sphingopyxis sp. MSC1_008 TaxID=2909265 RepID=UPI0020BF5092|nr:hypothetical protein [Sphingopyxis sp. MSC1_008]
MKYYALIGVAAFAATNMAVPAYAQTLSPTGVVTPASGFAALNGNPCTLTLDVEATGSGSGGNAGPGSNTGSGICPLITIDSGATFTLSNWNSTGGDDGIGSADGSLSNLVVRVNGTQSCPTGNGLGFTVENTLAGDVRIVFPVTMLGTCQVEADLNAAFTLNP